MAVVIDVLHEEHRNIARLLDALEHQIDVFERADRPDYDVICGVSAYFLEFPDRCHHPKEDVVFRRLAAQHPHEASGLHDLLKEHAIVHDQAAAFADTVRDLLSDTDIPRDAVVAAARGFIDTQRRHLRAEEAHFFPVAERVLSGADWAEVERELTGGPDPLFGGRIEARFRTLSDRLLAWEAEDRAGEPAAAAAG
jgi:hemerythrin-like domain-containing protein